MFFSSHLNMGMDFFFAFAEWMWAVPFIVFPQKCIKTRLKYNLVPDTKKSKRTCMVIYCTAVSGNRAKYTFSRSECYVLASKTMYLLSILKMTQCQGIASMW